MFDFMDNMEIERLEVPPERNFFARTPIIAAGDRMLVWENTGLGEHRRVG